ncbi:hypothetical protein, partial [Methylomonas albis]
ANSSARPAKHLARNPFKLAHESFCYRRKAFCLASKPTQLCEL